MSRRFFSLLAFMAIVGLSIELHAAEWFGIARIPDPPPAIDGTLGRLATSPSTLSWSDPAQFVIAPEKRHGDADLSGQVFFGWDQNFLFIGAKVKDDRIVQPFFGRNLWKGDHLEVFIDAPRKPAGARDKKQVIHIGLSPGNFETGPAAVQAELVVWQPDTVGVEGSRIAAVRTSDGYQIEAAIPWKQLGISEVVEGVALGIEVALSDCDEAADGTQETVASLLPLPWSLRDPDRMIEAVLAGTTGQVDPSTIKSAFKLLAEDVRVESGKSANIDVSAVDADAVKELVVRGRLHYDKFAGGTAALAVEVNGTTMTLERVRNRLPKFQLGTSQISTASNIGWFTLYAPNFNIPDPFSPYAVRGVNPFEWRFDVSDLWKSSGNVVTVKHVQPKVAAPLALDIGVSEQLSAKLTLPPRRPAPTGEIPVIMPGTQDRPDYAWRQLPGGAIEVTLGARRWVIESDYSTLKPSWASLAPQVSGEWKELHVSGDAAAASTGDFSIARTIVRHDDHLHVTDRITNLSGDDLPVMVRHHAELGEGVTEVFIGGKPVANPRFRADEGAHPASLGLYVDGGLGLISEDDIMRAISSNYREENTIGIHNGRLVVAKGATVAVEFSIYPLEKGGNFTFINRVRRNWNVNFTIDGSFAFVSPAPPLSTYTDEQFKAYLVGKTAKYVCAGPPSYKGSATHGSGYLHVDHSPRRDLLARAKAIVPGTKTFYYFHSFISVHEDDKSTYADAILRRPDGSQADYSSPKYPLFVPREGTSFAALQDELIDLRFDQLDLDGIYWDELEYSAFKYDYSDQWDGVTADIDPKTHKIRRKIANITLATQPWRIKAVDHILSRGMLIGNGAPMTRTMMQRHYPRFIETGSITNLTNGQLYTPIALGDHLTERNAVDAYKVMLEALSLGGVYYWYYYRVEPDQPTLTSVMFPITPVELGPGYIIGKERIITNRSGLFGWGDDAMFEVVVFDDQGKRTDQVAVPRKVMDGKAYAEVRIAEGYSAAIVRK